MCKKNSKILTHSLLPQRRAFIKKCIEAVILDPVRRKVHIKLDINPFLIQNDDTNKAKKLEVSEFDTSSEMVAGACFECVWKNESKIRRTSSTDIIPALCKQKVFSRNFMENTLGLTTGQAYWYIKRLLHTGMIRKLKRTEYVGNKGKQQALYKFILK